MLDSIKRQVGSGGDKYDLEVSFKGMNEEQVQQDAMSFYVWKVQRTIRDADDDAKVDMLENGITLHATEVGKPVVSTSQMVDKMSDGQALEALEQLKTRLGK